MSYSLTEPSVFSLVVTSLLIADFALRITKSITKVTPKYNKSNEVKKLILTKNRTSLQVKSSS